ncbi:carboxypeptidase-like regulatory domain-containing protein [Salegentibacter sp. F188]|uniref:Carboxypeptidase-like regulatory domain-containing protein n=1 Tax=Autumnicola patrickiae TaxID=3075591 RepID=A0ABU3E3S1_9FLAO|nr:carboxypeptidase-like regulatory domain-containing protein [Salegentibacter sp. F188]MDT0690624.1 carboxypeptidase-like regulatory domain-containing protein [Salegentibacter sp. F188]
METIISNFGLRKMYSTLLLLIFALSPALGAAFQEPQTNSEQFSVYKGIVVNSESNDPIASASIAVNRSNISTISNTDGEFSLRVPDNLLPVTVTVSMLGYNSKSVPLSYFQDNNRIELINSVEELSEVNIFNANDPRRLVNKMLQKKDDNYFSDETLMTSFYRETIKRRRTNVSLSEAVVKIHKNPHTSNKKDLVSIYKSRKSTDYDKLDTLALKLRGGPFNALYLDLIKYTEYVLQPGMTDNYEFSFDEPTKIDEHYIYVVNFEEKDKSKPWYFGQLFIDANSLTLVRAEYKLNVDDRRTATQMFVKKKPSGSKVYPVDLSYQVDYVKNDDGKWHYSYGNAVMEYVVNWKRKIFNSRYTVNSEMVVTDWEKYTDNGDQKNTNYIDPYVVMSDDDAGFYDAEFWGNNNIIEPEKSIQNAIEKIQKNMENN